MRNQRTTVGTLGVLLFAIADVAHGYSSGISGVARTGCTCHSASPSGDTTVTTKLSRSGTGANVTVTITSPVPRNGANQGGFNLEVTHGLLSKIASNDDKVQIYTYYDVPEASHTAAGNDQRSWTVHWEPPPTPFCRYELHVAANAVNGDGFPSSLDHWQRRSLARVDDGAGDAVRPSNPVVLEPQHDTVVGGDVTIRATATDDRGIDYVEVLDSDVNGTTTLGRARYRQSENVFEYVWLTAREPNGSHTLGVRAVDCAGNRRKTDTPVFVSNP